MMASTRAKLQALDPFFSTCRRYAAFGLGRLQVGEIPPPTTIPEWVPPPPDTPPPRRHRLRTRGQTVKLWRKFFADPSQWSDLRAHKVKPKQPDWVHKETEEALWIESASTPPWARRRLTVLPRALPSPAQAKTIDDEDEDEDDEEDERGRGRGGVGSTDHDTQEMATMESMARDSWCGWTSRGGSYAVRRPRRERVVIGSDDDIRDLCLHGRPRNALHVLEQRGIDPSSYAYVCLLRRCTNLQDLIEGRYVHAHMASSDFTPSTFVLNALLNMYMKCGSFEEARGVFDRMQERDMFTWTMMVAGCARLGRAEAAYEAYEQMQRARVAVDSVTFTTILSVCTALRSLAKGQRVHHDMIRANLPPDLILSNALIDMYSKCGDARRAHEVFQAMPERDVVTWNIMISGAAHNGEFEQAFQLFEEMRKARHQPDTVTYMAILNACSSVQQGRVVHSQIVGAGFALDVRVGTALVNMYSKCGSVEDALHVFERMPQRNVVSWTSMIAAYAQSGRFHQALECYNEMLKVGVRPDKRTYTIMFDLSATLGDLARGLQVRDHMLKSGIALDSFVENTLIHMYCKCGRMEEAQELLRSMKERDVVSYTAMIGGCVQLGQFREAMDVFDDMEREGVVPNSATFMAVLKACVGLGSLVQGRRVEDCIGKAGMSEDPNIKHALADMYARCPTPEVFA